VSGYKSPCGCALLAPTPCASTLRASVTTCNGVNSLTRNPNPRYSVLGEWVNPHRERQTIPRVNPVTTCHPAGTSSACRCPSAVSSAGDSRRPAQQAARQPPRKTAKEAARRVARPYILHTYIYIHIYAYIGGTAAGTENGKGSGKASREALHIHTRKHTYTAASWNLYIASG